ncbi:hypothetical protein CPB86DRAFT_797211 [Serendipita vermifera]|nr:hypothetical protein CPB86DRAFT_797211 [Serendipita vermifera]
MSSILKSYFENHLRTNMYAGIAVGRVAENAPFCCTRFTGSERRYLFDFAVTFNPSPPTEHMLSSDVPEEIVDSILTKANLRTVARKKAFTLSYPITTPQAHQVAFEVADQHAHDHCTAFLSACEFGVVSSEGVVEMMFIDLTPGQVAAVVMQGVINEGRWISKKVRKKVTLGSVDKLSIQKVVDEIITPLAPDWSNLQCVGILRPEGAFPELLPIKMELQFINIPVRWLSLADLSYGSAMLLYRRVGLSFRSHFLCGTRRYNPPWYVELADGRLVNMLAYGYTRYFFTTSKDYQATATLRLSRGDILYDEVVIEGLIPKLKGVPRIKVTIDTGFAGQTTVTVQEWSSNLEVNLALTGGTYIEATGNKWIRRYPIKPVFGVDGVVGELPE